MFRYIKAATLLQAADGATTAAALLAVLAKMFQQVRDGVVPLTIIRTIWIAAPSNPALAMLKIYPCYQSNGGPPNYYVRISRGGTEHGFVILAPEHVPNGIEVPEWYADLWAFIRTRKPGYRDVGKSDLVTATKFLESL